jgi:hypothetical protein
MNSKPLVIVFNSGTVYHYKRNEDFVFCDAMIIYNHPWHLFEEFDEPPAGLTECSTCRYRVDHPNAAGMDWARVAREAGRVRKE